LQQEISARVSSHDGSKIAGTKTRVAKNALIYSAAQVVSWIVTLVYVLIIPSRLGEIGMGRFTLISNLFTPFSVVHFGLEQYLIKEVGRDPGQARPLLAATLSLRLILIPIFFAMTMSTLAVLHSSREIWIMGTLSILVSLAVLIGDPLRSVLAGWEDAKKVALLDLVTGSSVLVALPFLQFGPVALFSALFVTCYVSVIMRFVWLRPVIGLWFSPKTWRMLLAGGLPFIVNVWLLQMYSFAGVFSLKHFADDAALGVWGTAQKLYTPFMSFSTILGYALLPALSRLAHTDMSEFRNLQSRVLTLLVIIGLPVSVGVALLAPSLCHLLYPGQYAGLPLTLQIMAVATIPVYIVMTMYQFLVAQNRNAVWSVFLVGTVLLYSALNAMVIPFMLDRFRNAAAGVAVSLAIAEICTSVAALILLRSNPFTWESARRVGGAVAATAVMALVICLEDRIPQKGGRFVEAFRTLGMTMSALIAFSLCAWRMHILTEGEQNRLVDLVKHKLLRR